MSFMAFRFGARVADRPGLPLARARAVPVHRLSLSSGRWWTAAAKTAAVAVLLVLLYQPVARWMAARFAEPDSHYAHGFLVPVIAAVLAFRARRGVRWGADPAPVAGGCALVGGAVLHLARSALGVSFFAGLSLVPVAGGLVLLFGGRGAARPLAFPILFLLFMVPVPMWVLANVSFPLKLATAGAALRLAEGFGVVALREGAVIHFAGGGSLVVGEVCGGLRYLVALTATGALMAHLAPLRAGGRALLLALAVPAALAANVARVLLLVLLGPEVARGRAHDASGFLLFAVAALLLAGADRALRPFLGRRP
jgi:exosortase